MDSPVNDHLYAIWAGSAQDIFAVGDGGRILRSTGAPSSRSTARQASRYTACGQQRNRRGLGGRQRRRHLEVRPRRGSWSSVSSPTTNQLNAIWGSAKNRVYVAANGGTVLRYDGTSWG